MSDSVAASDALATPLAGLDVSSTPRATSPEASRPNAAASTNVTATPAAQQHQPDGHILGLRKDGMAAHNVFSDDYEKLLPDDEYGQEAAPNARVWRAYEQEAATYDTAMIGQARDGLDVMLAGLFSAVVTSFLVQVSQNLQPDFAQMNSLLLYDLVVMQMQTIEGGAAPPNVTAPSANPNADFTPDALDVWVNGLWVISLVASLFVALSAVLVKQWLHRYMTLPSGTAGLRSHTRHFRFVGFEEWHVEAVIGTLPIIMQLSLMLFFVGLVLFYVPLRLSLACSIGVLSAFVLISYVSSTILPLFRPQCPYQTPLTDFLPHLLRAMYSAVSTGRRSLSTFVRKALQSRLGQIVVRSALAERAGKAVDSVRNLVGLTSVSRTPPQRPALLMAGFLLSSRQRETHAVELSYDEISVDAMHWVFHLTGNPTIHTVVLHAISGLPYEIREYAQSKWKNDDLMLSKRHDLLRRDAPPKESELWRLLPDEPPVERLLRSAMFLPYHGGYTIPSGWHVYAAVTRLWAASWLPRNVDNPPSTLTPNEMALSLYCAIKSLKQQNIFLHRNLWRDFFSRILVTIDSGQCNMRLSAALLSVLISPGTDWLVSEVEHPKLDVMDYEHAMSRSSTSLRHHVFSSLAQSLLLSPFIDHSEVWSAEVVAQSSPDDLLEVRVMGSILRFVLHHNLRPESHTRHQLVDFTGSETDIGRIFRETGIREPKASPYLALLKWFSECMMRFSGRNNAIIMQFQPELSSLLLVSEAGLAMTFLEPDISPMPFDCEVQQLMLGLLKMLLYAYMSFPWESSSLKFRPLPEIFAGVLPRYLGHVRRCVLSSSMPEGDYLRLPSWWIAVLVLDITLQVALDRSNPHPEAYRAFFDLGWLSMTCEFAMLGAPSLLAGILPDDFGAGIQDMKDRRIAGSVVSAFVDGHHLLPPEDRVAFLRTLQQPQNLQMVILIIICHPPGPVNTIPLVSPNMVITMLGLSSGEYDHASLDVAIALLHSLRAWFEYQLRALPEPERGFVEPEFPLDNQLVSRLGASHGDHDSGADATLAIAIQKVFANNAANFLDAVRKFLAFLEDGGPWPWPRKILTINLSDNTRESG